MLATLPDAGGPAPRAGAPCVVWTALRLDGALRSLDACARAADSLYAQFFEAPGEMALHNWCEWIKETWLPVQQVAAA
eukprot:5639204-Prymnesium_polylepis.1